MISRSQESIVEGGKASVRVCVIVDQAICLAHQPLRIPTIYTNASTVE
jgi:hypothetical protein